jgi:hypothetical protein
VNQNNFLRNIKNFKIDLRLTDPKAYICGIHWQVAQGTSLENIEFYMRYNVDTPGNTQQVRCSALMPYAATQVNLCLPVSRAFTWRMVSNTEEACDYFLTISKVRVGSLRI